MPLVSCARIGQDLIQWLTNATQAQRDALCAALACPDNDTYQLLSCAGAPIASGDQVPTCAELTAAIQSVSFNTANTNTALFSGSGSTVNPKRVDVRISAEPDNAVDARVDGLYSGVTRMSWDNTTSEITFTDQNGNVTTIDLSQFLTDIHITGAAFDPVTAQLTLTPNDPAQPDVVVDLAALAKTSTEDTPTISMLGDGSPGNKLRANARASQIVGNRLQMQPDGLYVPAALDSVATADSATIDLSGAGSVADPLTGAVRVSAAPGNRIQVLADGLAVIDEAPVNLAVQFVSVSGNDANDGSRASPLATLREALRRISMGPGVGRYMIAFKAGETFNIDTEVAETPNASLIFSVYDDPIYGDAVMADPAPGYYAWAAPNLSRPVLDFGVYNVAGFLATPVVRAANIRLDGFVVLGPSQTPTYPGVQHYNFETAGELNQRGCDITMRSAFTYLARAQIMWGQGLILTLPANTTWGEYRSTYTADEDNAFNIPFSAPGYPSFTGRASNARALLTPANIQSYGGYDVTTKSTFGWDVTWDIFA